MGARTLINGRERDYFAGCGYFGLQGHPALTEVVQTTVAQFGVHTGTARSRTGFGDSPVYVEFDRQAQLFFQADRNLYFPSAYFGMSILAQGLTEKYDHILIDEATHYSGFEGAQSTGKPITTFLHLDAESLEEACRKMLSRGERPLVMSDGLFPVSGAIAPADKYLKIVRKYDGLICLDDAHATGVLGENGRGTLEHHKISGNPNCFAAHTLSKALGSFGGLVPGDAPLMETIDRHVRIHMGASKPPVIIAAAAGRAMELVRTNPVWRINLWKNVSRARSGLRALGWIIPETPSPIICLGAIPGLDMERIQQELIERDICIAYVGAYNDVPEGGALRIAIFSTHTADQIDRLILELGRLL